MTGDHYTLTSARVDPNGSDNTGPILCPTLCLSLLPPSEHRAVVSIGTVPLPPPLGTDPSGRGGVAVGIPGESVLQTLGVTVSFV